MQRYWAKLREAQDLLHKIPDGTHSQCVREAAEAVRSIIAEIASSKPTPETPKLYLALSHASDELHLAMQPLQREFWDRAGRNVLSELIMAHSTDVQHARKVLEFYHLSDQEKILRDMEE